MFSSDLSTWIGAVVAVIGALSFLIWKYISRNDDYWTKQGVNSAPRGNNFTALRELRKKGFHEIVLENARKYGDTFGAFEGSEPIVVCSDPDLIKDVMVKDFHKFSYRRDLESGDPVIDSFVSILKGEDWKRVRTIITPAFTSKRMRQMSSVINRCSKSVADSVEKDSETGKAVDFKRLFGAFTMDVIAASAFGTKIDPYKDGDNVFIKEAKEFFLDLNSWSILFFLILPSWMLKYLGISFFNTSPFFKDIIMEVIKTRKEQNKKYNDILQILMDAADEQNQEEHADLNVDEEDRYGSITTKESQLKYKSISQNELLAQCVMFFSVGYETTASILTFMAYSLATNPEWQEKLIAEVDEGFKNHAEMSYDAVRSMKVLDAVISETLRMYPPVVVTERTATEDYKLGDTGIFVKKGMHVSMPIYVLHFNNKYFEDPKKFDPDRFLDSSKATYHQYAYLPFGAGPRNCLGMRFALLEIKLCMTNMLRRYRFRTHSSTKVPVEFRKESSFLSVAEMPLRVEKRTDV